MVTQNLAARWVSSAALERLDTVGRCSLLGAYERSLNLECGGDVLSVVSPETGNLPMGILVGLPQGMAWKHRALEVGQKVMAYGRILSLHDGTRIDLRSASIWQSRRRLEPVDPDPRALRSAADQARQGLVGADGLAALGERIPDLASGRYVADGSDPVMVRAASPRLAALMEQCRTQDASGLLDQARALVGLGIGLTPSGDDVLTGFFGSTVLMQAVVPELTWLLPVAKGLEGEAGARTNLVGGTYLRCACRGEIMELQEVLLKALMAGDGRASLAACLTLRKFGHSSGGEIAFGTLLAAEAAARTLEA